MTSSIVSNFNDFSFDGLSLAQPHALQGGTYFTRLTNNGNSMYVQTPKCSTKQGITKTEHKIYTDLMFSHDEESFISWLETLELKLQQLIYDKRTLWFHNDLDLEDIETAFTSLTRSYKSGKSILVRCNLGKNNNTGLKQEIKIFNESEKDVKLDEIKANDNVITILEISGIRFSSRSFHVDLYVKQLMVFQNDSPFKSCLIKPVDKIESKQSLEKRQPTSTGDESEDDSVSSLSEVDSEESEEESEEPKAVETDSSARDVKDEKPQEPQEVMDSDKNMTKQGSQCEPTLEKEESLGDMQEVPVVEDVLDKNTSKQDNTKCLEEVELSFETVEDEIKLRDPNEVYMQIYMEARQKAKLAKKAAIEAYLEAKKIKNTYLLEEIDDSDEEEISSFSEN